MLIQGLVPCIRINEAEIGSHVSGGNIQGDLFEKSQNNQEKSGASEINQEKLQREGKIDTLNNA